MSVSAGKRFDQARVLITSARRYFAAPVIELFEREGATVIADDSDYVADPQAPQRIVEQAGRIDILIPQFAGPPEAMPFTNLLKPTLETSDEDVQAFLDELLWPMTRFVRAALPQMIERREGKIVAITSASPMRAIPGASVYSGIRAYQNAFLQCVGAEAAPFNVQVNAVAPAFLNNVSYVPDELMENGEAIQPLLDMIPAGRVGSGEELAEMVLALAGPASGFMAGQAIPMAGGWIT